MGTVRHGAFIAISACRSTFSTTTDLIDRYTKISRQHLTPEMPLHLITQDCPAWTEPVDINLPHPLGEPYWAFYWPGGQALCRYILDYPSVVCGKRVLDFGAGSGCCSIAALRSGARSALANDIDPMAVASSLVNANLNGVSLDVCTEDRVGSDCDAFDVVLVGDMLYDSHLSLSITAWLNRLRRRGKTVLVGDPGRGAVDSSRWLRLAKYELKPITKLENYGFNSASVLGLRTEQKEMD